MHVFHILVICCLLYINFSHSPFSKIQEACKFSEYFTKPDDRCILCNEIVHTTFGSTSQEDHDVQIAVGTRVEPTQIPERTNYARSVRQPFPSNIGLRFSREMVVATIGPFQILRSLCVIDTNFMI
jgi:thymidine kinase